MTQDISDNFVTTTKLADGAVTTSKLRPQDGKVWGIAGFGLNSERCEIPVSKITIEEISTSKDIKSTMVLAKICDEIAYL